MRWLQVGLGAWLVIGVIVLPPFLWALARHEAREDDAEEIEATLRRLTWEGRKLLSESEGEPYGH